MITLSIMKRVEISRTYKEKRGLGEFDAIRTYLRQEGHRETASSLAKNLM